jgi:2'-5' RNA ligase
MEYKQVFTTALCIIPPQEVWAPMQLIREKYDKGYVRWMPHFNFLYPFVTFDEFPEAEKLLKESLSKIKPFKVKLEKFGSFDQKNESVLWIKPESDVIREVNNQISKVYKPNRKDFVPHISVGQFPKNEIQTWLKKFQKEWKPIEFECNEICLIGRYGFDDPMKVRAVIPFGDAKSSIEIFPIKIQENFNVYVSNLDEGAKEKDIFEFFSKFNVRKITIPRDKITNATKGYCFLDFDNPEDQKKVIDLKTIKINGMEVTLKKAK